MTVSSRHTVRFSSGFTVIQFDKSIDWMIWKIPGFWKFPYALFGCLIRNFHFIRIPGSRGQLGGGEVNRVFLPLNVHLSAGLSKMAIVSVQTSDLVCDVYSPISFCLFFRSRYECSHGFDRLTSDCDSVGWSKLPVIWSRSSMYGRLILLLDCLLWSVSLIIQSPLCISVPLKHREKSIFLLVSQLPFTTVNFSSCNKCSYAFPDI